MSSPTPADIEKLLREREWLGALARRLLGDGPDAEDLAQETLARALQSGRVPARPRRWLRVVARNLRFESRRGEARRRAREREVARPESTSDDDPLGRVSLRHRLLEHVLELAEPGRTALVLRYIEGLPYEEVAARQGASVVAVRKRVSRAIDRLKERLDSSEGGREARASLLAPLADLDAGVRSAGRAAPASLPLATGVFALSTHAKLAVGTGVLAALVVVLAVPFDVLSGPGPRPAAPTGAPPAELLAADRGSRDAAVESAATGAPARSAVEDETALGVGDGVVTGLVLDHVGAPLPGAHVQASTLAKTDYDVLDLAYGRESSVLAETSTGSDGRFSLEVDPHRPLDLRVSEERHARAAVRAYGGEDVVVRMELEAIVEGRITRASDGLPLEGVLVRGWRRRPSMVRFDGLTDSSGFFRFDGLSSGQFLLAVEPEDLMNPSWTTIDLQPGLFVRRDYALERGIRVSGRVTDAETGEPIAGAEIGPGWTLRFAVRSDHDGRYELHGFGGPGVHDIHVRAKGYGRSSRDYGNSVPSEDTELDFALSPARSARGRVVAPDGRPMEGVYVAGVGMHGLSGEWEGTRTDVAGAFALTSLVPQTRHQLFVQARGYGTLVIDFPPDEAARPIVELGDVRLPGAACLSGRVTDELGNPRPGVDVRLQGRHDGAGRFDEEGRAGLSHHMTDAREVVADSLGRFHFTDVAPGTYTVVASLQHGQQDGEALVTVAEGERVGDLVLTLPVGLSIRGVVLTSRGEPCARVSVSVVPEGRSVRPAYATTDAHGRFEVTGLTDDDYVVWARPWTYNSLHPEAPVFERSATVRGGTDGLRIELPPSVELVGVVRTETGAPVTNVVVVVSDSVTGDRIGVARAEEGGSFRMLVPAGALVDLETRDVRGADAASTSHRERDARSVTEVGVEPGVEVVLTVDG